MAFSTRILGLSLLWGLLAGIHSQEVTYTVLEEEDEHTIGNLVADLSLELPPDAEFKFLTSAWDNQTYFRLDARTGEISTTQPIDRETICPPGSGSLECRYELEVLVLPQSSYHFIRVHIVIEDVNDHAPTFRLPVLQLETSENVQVGTRIPLETAGDPDVGPNSVQDYALVDDMGGTFALFAQRQVDGTISLQLVVVAELDREVHSSYLLMLLAHDGGDPPSSGSVALNVTVLDSNDNTPTFVRPSYTVSVTENTPVGTELLQVEAMDPDIGTNGQIEYSFSSSVTQAARRALEIDPVTGVITVRGTLDYEQQPSFQLTVKAANRVTNPVPDFASVTVNLIDANDNYPSLTVRPLDEGPNRWVYLPEDTPAGTLVAFIKASDEDNGGTGRVRVSLSNTHSDFGLQEVSEGQYFVSILRSLDREAVEVYNITVEAMDSGSPAKSTLYHLVVVVEDVNDNPPFFATPVYYANVDENNAPSLPVATLSAQDPDEGTNSVISYELLTQRDSFAVDASTGVVTAEVVLDRESRASVSLFLRACDHGMPRLCSNATVVVEVQDKNDHGPVFQQPTYQFSIPENQFVDSTVGYTKATDGDAGRNAQLTYSIREENSNGASDFFRIVPQTGKILNKKVIDREVRDEFLFTVIAADHGVTSLTSEVVVRITVQDKNDNAPRVVFPSAGNVTFFIPQAAEAGFPVITVDATDMDQGANGQLSYSISGGSKGGVFGINAAGRLLTARKISSTMEGVHPLTVQISDGGTPPQTTPLELIIVVTDLDFNASLPAKVFFERFNLTAADFGLEEEQEEDREPQFNPLSSWPVLTGIVLGSAVILLLAVFLLARCKCRSQAKPVRVYTVPEDLPSSECSEAHPASPKRKLSDDSSHVSLGTSVASIPSKNIMKWRTQAGQANGTLDSRLGNSQMTTFGSNSDIGFDTSARRTPDADVEVQRLTTLLHGETDAVSDNSNRSSYDSGQGDHDEPESSQDVFPIQNYGRGGAPRSASCPRLSGLSSPTGQGAGQSREHYMASPRCTLECATLGHSDECWNVSLSPPRRPHSVTGITGAVSQQQPIHRPIGLYAGPSQAANGSYDSYGSGRPSSSDFSRSGSGPARNHVGVAQGDAYATVARAKPSRPTPAADQVAASTADHSSKHHRNSTPLLLTPITEDPMEVADGRRTPAYSDPYSTHNRRFSSSSSDQVYPISSQVRAVPHGNGTAAYSEDSWRQPQWRSSIGKGGTGTSGCQPQRSMQTCL